MIALMEKKETNKKITVGEKYALEAMIDIAIKRNLNKEDEDYKEKQKIIDKKGKSYFNKW